MIIECEEYQIVLNNGANIKVICSDSDLDELIKLIGEENITEIRE